KDIKEAADAEPAAWISLHRRPARGSARRAFPNHNSSGQRASGESQAEHLGVVVLRAIGVSAREGHAHGHVGVAREWSEGLPAIAGHCAGDFGAEGVSL